jgi:hypothetical protein
MSRTTVNIDDPVLEEVKRVQRREGKSLGRLVSELLAEALSRRAGEASEPPGFDWTSKQMGARVDLQDKEAVYRILDAKP